MVDFNASTGDSHWPAPPPLSARRIERPQRRRSSVCETPKARVTQGRILDAAMRIITTEGYRALQYGRIAEVAGVARGVINYHFRTQSELTRAIVGFIGARKSERLSALSARLRLVPEDQIEQAIDGYWALLHEPPFVAYAELEHAARTDRTLKRALQQPRHRLDKGIAESRALDPTVDAQTTDRQALYDFSRFLLEGLAKGMLTYERTAREARLLRLLKRAIAALYAPASTPPLWLD